MKTLFIGGVKSGKSQLAEQFILQHYPDAKPYYLATTEFIDAEMQQRISRHQQRRHPRFITLEAPRQLYATLLACEQPVLVECVTMWLNNMLYYQVPTRSILQELEKVLQLPLDLVLVHNEVGFGIIPDNPLARTFVDLSGAAAQILGQACDRVMFCSAGLTIQMK